MSLKISAEEANKVIQFIRECNDSNTYKYILLLSKKYGLMDAEMVNIAIDSGLHDFADRLSSIVDYQRKKLEWPKQKQWANEHGVFWLLMFLNINVSYLLPRLYRMSEFDLGAIAQKRPHSEKLKEFFLRIGINVDDNVQFRAYINQQRWLEGMPAYYQSVSCLIPKLSGAERESLHMISGSKFTELKALTWAEKAEALRRWIHEAKEAERHSKGPTVFPNTKTIDKRPHQDPNHPRIVYNLSRKRGSHSDGRHRKR